MVYFDYAANYPVKKEVIEELSKVELNYVGNAMSLHQEGRKAYELYQDYNQKIASLLNIDLGKYEIIYTSSASEAANLCLKGIAASYSGFGKHILVSQIEHSATNATLAYLKDEGYEIEFIKTTSKGLLDLEDLRNKIRQDTILITICLVDGELGAVQDYLKIIDIVKKYPNIHLAFDVTQGITKFNFDFSNMELFFFAPHKFGGLTGTGVLVKRKETILTPLIHGGSSYTLYRSGTISVGFIASTYKALSLTMPNIEKNYQYVKSLHEYLIENIKKLPNIMINSFDNPYLVNISFKNKKGIDILHFLDEKGICVSLKSACSVINSPSKIIMASYHDKKRATSSVRISLADLTKHDEIDYLITCLKEIV